MDIVLGWTRRESPLSSKARAAGFEVAWVQEGAEVRRPLTAAAEVVFRRGTHPTTALAHIDAHDRLTRWFTSESSSGSLRQR